LLQLVEEVFHVVGDKKSSSGPTVLVTQTTGSFQIYRAARYATTPSQPLGFADGWVFVSSTSQETKRQLWSPRLWLLFRSRCWTM